MQTKPNHYESLHRRLDADDQYALDERAAILEYDAGYTREAAEARALTEFLAASKAKAKE